jgi:Zn-dependent protease with chaperone function
MNLFHLLKSKGSFLISFFLPAVPKELPAPDWLAREVSEMARKVGCDRIETAIYDSPDPGGHIRLRLPVKVSFSSSLVERMTREEIIAMAAHEISHIEIEKTLSSAWKARPIFSGLAFLAVLTPLGFNEFAIGNLLLALLASITAVMLFILGMLWSARRSRQVEKETDEFAANLVGGHSLAEALMSLWGEYGKLYASPAEIIYPEGGYLWNLFSTHPSYQERISTLLINF